MIMAVAQVKGQLQASGFIPSPKDQVQKNHNKEVLKLLEKKKSQRKQTLQ